MSTPLKWIIAGVIAWVAMSIAGIWLEGDTALTVRAVLAAVVFCCNITGFVIWFRRSQR